MTPAGRAGAPAAGFAAEAAGAAAPALWGAAKAEADAPQKTKEKAKIRAFSKIFRAPTKFDPVLVHTGTAGESCKYVARGREDALATPNHSTTVT